MEKKIQILIADDNKNLCQTLKDVFHINGHHADFVHDGYELLGYLEKKVPEVIILDIMMPAKGGLDVLNTIKSVSPAIKVVIYTGFEKYKNSAYISVADKFLLKNEAPEKVVEAVEALL